MKQDLRSLRRVFQALTAAASLHWTTAAAAERVNFVFFLADDLGWRDLGRQGSTFYETPNLDRLAASGMRFTDAYSACQVCSPTRAAILTGKYPARTGVTDYIGAAQPENWLRPTRLLPAPYANRLALSEVTLAEALKAGGYATFFAGKWHLGPEGWWPENQGFDVNKGGCGRGSPASYFSPYKNPRLEDGPDGEHLPDRLAQETVKFIEANREQPFFAYLSLRNDMGETRNLVSQETDRAGAMQSQLRAWQREVGAKFPTPARIPLPRRNEMSWELSAFASVPV